MPFAAKPQMRGLHLRIGRAIAPGINYVLCRVFRQPEPSLCGEPVYERAFDRVAVASLVRLLQTLKPSVTGVKRRPAAAGKAAVGCGRRGPPP